MLIARQSVATRIPVRLVDGTGVPVTGKGSVAVLGGTVFLVKGDGTTATITLSNGVNWFEIDNTQAPGLYHVLVSGANLGVLGPTQLSVQPAATAFVGTIGTFLVESFAAEVDAVSSSQTAIQTAVTIVRKIQANRWKVVSNQLVVYDDNGTTPLYTFNLLDDTGAPTMTRIFERVPV